MNKVLLNTTFALLLLITGVQAGFAQHTGIKTNLPYWVTATINASFEQAMSRRLTFDINYGYNPLKLDLHDISMRHQIGRVGLRYFPCRVFTKWFFGLHALAGDYNLHNVPLINYPKDYVLQGWFYGGGLSVGRQYHLRGRWDLQLELDVSYVVSPYKKVECDGCKFVLERGRQNYIGPTKAAIALIYMIH